MCAKHESRMVFRIAIVEKTSRLWQRRRRRIDRCVTSGLMVG